MNKDQVKGRIEETKGKIKEATGVILDDENMEAEGNIQKNIGKAQSGLSDLKEDTKESIKKVIDKI
ncbi:CsbD family protein [Methylobacter psychrophilus]|uniref:CsbD family protein n=1 Tax=Methylobacter psychrophilus TaxID=96941 RepID=UPI0021D4EA40|nr:CsbD family protein [Methylobacter psychrophilus]